MTKINYSICQIVSTYTVGIIMSLRLTLNARNISQKTIPGVKYYKK